MKKNIFLSVIFTVILTTVLILTVTAAEPSIEVTSVSAHRGETVEIVARLSGCEALASGGVSVTYDDAALELTEAAWKVPSGLIVDFDKEKNVGVFLYSSATDINGDILSLKFRVKDEAALSANAVTVEAVKMKNKDGNIVEIAGGSGSVTVECNHSFTKKDTSDKYLKSPADCTSKAVYYYCCEHCGEKGTETFEYGEMLPHVYDRQVTTEEYVKTPATCTSKAVYYYSCACGAKGTETFEAGEPLPHVYDQKVISDAYKKGDADCEHPAVYYYSCKCGAKGTETFEEGKALGHTGGTATCTEKAVCSRCGKPYGETLPHTFDQKVTTDKYLKSPASCVSKAVYYYSCACGEKGTKTFEAGEILPHVYDKKVTTDKYLKSPATCTSKAVYYYSCACGAKGTETFEYGPEPAHSYAEKWSSDGSSHWHECTKCGAKKDEAAHTPGPAATEYSPQVCTVCGYVITPAYGHTHHFGEAWKSDVKGHWHECDGCSERSEYAEHVYDNDCDAECNICGYRREVTHKYGDEWKTDGENHWHECTICGDKKDMGKHVPGPEATETSPQICTVCGHILKEALGHTHKFGDEWKSDANGHWHECDCGERADAEEHKWDEGTITKSATTEEEGIKTYKCTICGYEKKEAIAKLQPSETTTEPEDTTVTPGDEVKGGRGCGSRISTGSIIVMLAGMIGGAVILRKKRK